MNAYKRILSASLALLLIATPFAAFAQDSDHSDLKLKNSTGVQVLITDPGTVLVRGAKVTSVSGSTVNAQTTWGASTLNWTLTTDGATKYYTMRDGTGTLGQIVVGDTVSFAGTLTGVNGFSVRVSALKDWTLESNAASVAGSVVSVNTASNLLVMKRGSSNLTVQLTATTALTQKNGGATTLAAVQVGDTIKAVGTYNTDKTVLTATSVVVTLKVTADERKFNSLIKSWFSNHFNFGVHLK